METATPGWQGEGLLGFLGEIQYEADLRMGVLDRSCSENSLWLKNLMQVRRHQLGESIRRRQRENSIFEDTMTNATIEFFSNTSSSLSSVFAALDNIKNSPYNGNIEEDDDDLYIEVETVDEQELSEAINSFRENQAIKLAEESNLESKVSADLAVTIKERKSFSPISKLERESSQTKTDTNIKELDYENIQDAIAEISPKVNEKCSSRNSDQNFPKLESKGLFKGLFEKSSKRKSSLFGLKSKSHDRDSCNEQIGVNCEDLVEERIPEFHHKISSPKNVSKNQKEHLWMHLPKKSPSSDSLVLQDVFEDVSENSRAYSSSLQTSAGKDEVNIKSQQTRLNHAVDKNSESTSPKKEKKSSLYQRFLDLKHGKGKTSSKPKGSNASLFPSIFQQKDQRFPPPPKGTGTPSMAHSGISIPHKIYQSMKTNQPSGSIYSDSVRSSHLSTSSSRSSIMEGPQKSSTSSQEHVQKIS